MRLVHAATDAPSTRARDRGLGRRRVRRRARELRRAIAAGLTFRPTEQSARDALAWLATLDDAARAKVRSTGISRDRELAVLAAWKAKIS